MRRRGLYASRGFATRGSTRRGRRAGSVWSGAILALVVVAALAGGLWLRDRWEAGAPLVASQIDVRPPFVLDRSVASRPPTSATADPQATPQAAPPLLRVDESPTPESTLSSTPVVTVRQWETRADGVAIDQQLVGQLDQVLAGVDGKVSVAVKDLGSGRGAVLDGGRELEAASLFKLLVLYSVFESGLPLGADLMITEQARAYDLGTLELGAGETLTVAEALERMVTISDNTSAIMLGSRVGAGRVTRNIAAMGMESTHYSLERMTTSAVDMLALLELIAEGDAVSPSASAEMVHLLLRQRVKDRLPRLVPDSVRVANKTGNLPGVVNDVGLLDGPSSTVAVAGLISDTTNEAAAAAAIARMALVAHTYFEEQASARRVEIPPAPARAVPPVWRQPRPPPPTPTPEPTEVPIVIEPTATPSPVPTVVPATPTPAAPTPLPSTPTAVPKPAAPTPAPSTPTAAPNPAAPTAAPKPAAPTAAPKPAATTPGPTAAASTPTPPRKP
jgi:beta-lactamase class A